MRQKEQVYPVYLLAGFLDSGKTTFINNILRDGFAEEDKTLLISTEEGEEEYDKGALKNVTILTVDDPDLLTPEFLLFEQKKPPINKGVGVVVDDDVADGVLIIVVGRGVGILLALIDTAGGHPVTEHLCHIFLGHLAPAHVHAALGIEAIVDPILEVMAVATLVVQPR